MKSGDIFGNNPHWAPPGVAVGYMQTLCGTCRKSINLTTAYQISGVSSCYDCWHDHKISFNVCPCPYRVPRSRKLIDRTEKDLSWTGLGQASGFTTTVAQTEAFIKNPTGGL